MQPLCIRVPQPPQPVRGHHHASTAFTPGVSVIPCFFSGQRLLALLSPSGTGLHSLAFHLPCQTGCSSLRQGYRGLGHPGTTEGKSSLSILSVRGGGCHDIHPIPSSPIASLAFQPPPPPRVTRQSTLEIGFSNPVWTLFLVLLLGLGSCPGQTLSLGYPPVLLQDVT